MSDWNPSSIQSKAGSVEEYAKQIEQMLWYASQYKVTEAKRGEFYDDMMDKIHRLDKAIEEYKKLDTESILLRLQKDLVAFKAGIL